jgi:hypothetical protein
VSICWNCCQLSDEKERETIDSALPSVSKLGMMIILQKFEINDMFPSVQMKSTRDA